MAFKTITARFPGTCVRCRKAGICDGREKITVGQSIRFGGRGQTYHLSKSCPASQEVKEEIMLAGQRSRAEDQRHAPDLDNYLESESEAWARRAEEGWGPGGY